MYLLVHILYATPNTFDGSIVGSKEPRKNLFLPLGFLQGVALIFNDVVVTRPTG